MKRLIALAGHAGSGKNTVAKILGGYEISFADPLKKFCKELFDFSEDQIYGPSECRNARDPRYIKPDGEFLTPRFALQTLGTEWGRNCYEHIWAEFGVRRALKYLADPDLARCVPRLQTVIITDCRFINEARAVKKAGGEVWRIVRLGAGLSGAAALHPSEAEQESEEFLSLIDKTIENNGTLSDLERLCRDL